MKADATHVQPPLPRRRAWIDRWETWRDGLIANPLFRNRAASFGLTRPLARRRARRLFDLVAGFVYSQVLLACVKLRLFELLANGPQDLPWLAERMGLTVDAAKRLLAAATALDLVEPRSGERHGLGPLGAPMVGNAAIVAMVEHHAALYADLADPVALLRACDQPSKSGAVASFWPYAAGARGSADAGLGRYSALMAASQPLVSDEILDAYPLSKHCCLLDVGGGDGSFLVAAARRASSLKLMLFDLPPVADLARTRFRLAGLAGRAQVSGGNFLVDDLPKGADIASLVRVIHDHDDEAASVILRAVYRALPHGGTLLLAEPMSGTAGAEAVGDAYFGFYLMAMGRGRPRTRRELIGLVRAAGFSGVVVHSTSMPLQTGLLEARVNHDAE